MRYLLLDFDKTLSDQARLYPQFCQCIAERLRAQFGGDEAAVLTAVTDMLGCLVAEFEERFTGKPHAGYCAWLPQRHLRATEILSASLGFTPPYEAVQFARDVQYEALCRCDALYDGAAEALAEAADRGYPLVMASANESEFLEAALKGAGIAAHFSLPHFGPDTIDCAKEGPEFYQAIFESLGIRSQDAIVVDDKIECLTWARDLGTATLHANLHDRDADGDSGHSAFSHWNHFLPLLDGIHMVHGNKLPF